MDDFHFYCAICGNALNASSADAGGLASCPRCLHVVPIPGHPAAPRNRSVSFPVYRPGILALEMKILCPGCQSKLRIDARWEGAKADCPHCLERFSVPLWSQAGDRREPSPAAKPTLLPDEIEFLTELPPGVATERLAVPCP